MDQRRAHRAAPWRQLERASAVVFGAVSRHGFAQQTWRECLSDIQASLLANAGKLYAMGFRSAVKRATVADANELRD